MRFGVLALLVLFAGGCGSDTSSQLKPGSDPARPVPSSASQLRQGEAVISGMVLDARNGEPLAGVSLSGPGETRAVSDASGRFEIRGLEVGISGTLSGTLPDGREAHLELRPLRAGRLEVVLRLARPHKGG